MAVDADLAQRRGRQLPVAVCHDVGRDADTFQHQLAARCRRIRLVAILDVEDRWLVGIDRGAMGVIVGHPSMIAHVVASVDAWRM